MLKHNYNYVRVKTGKLCVWVCVWHDKLMADEKTGWASEQKYHPHRRARQRQVLCFMHHKVHLFAKTETDIVRQILCAGISLPSSYQH